MALKYWFEFTDIKEIVHSCKIYDNDFTGDSTLIYGNCNLTYAETDDVLSPIRGTGLKINLEANTDLTLSDLYTEEERTFRVQYFRDSVILFDGWINPEGIFEDLVYDKWVLSIDCVDGLGFLKGLSYVDENTKEPFSGKQTIVDIISNCLKRTQIEQGILIKVDFYYIGLDFDQAPLFNVYLNVDRFIKDDNTTIMDCYDILRSTLELFGAVLVFYNGYWTIYKPNLLADNSIQEFWNYDSDGSFNALEPQKTIDFSLNIGSQINGFYPHHVNANQQKTINRSVGALRISYKYGLVKSLFNNIYLENVFGVINEWSFVSTPPASTFPPDNMGVLFPTVELINVTTLMTSISFVLEQGNRIKFKTVLKLVDTNQTLNALFQVVLTDGIDTYYLDSNGNWSTNSLTRIDIKALSNGAFITYTVDSTGIPIDGDLSIKILSPYNDFEDNTVLISECGFSPLSEQEVKGEIITFQRVSKPSSKIAETKEVYNSESDTDLYYGTMYKGDGITPIFAFIRQSPFRPSPIAYLMGEERMKMYSKPTQIYKGDVYGFFNYLSVITIDGLEGVFMATSYNYSPNENITSVTLNQILNTDILSDIDYSFELDYGQVVAPTIK